MKSVRIGAGQGFYGDTPDGAVAVAQRGEVSYICCDALAELTMAILQKDRLRDRGGGFARDLPAFMRVLLPIARERGIRIITNAGGINPAGAARAVRDVAGELGIDDLRVATITGDDITDRIGELTAARIELRNMDSAPTSPPSAIASCSRWRTSAPARSSTRSSAAPTWSSPAASPMRPSSSRRWCTSSAGAGTIGTASPSPSCLGT